MKQPFAVVVATLAATCLAQAHFTYVVPDPGGATAKVVMNETPEPSAAVDVGMIGGTTLTLRDADGKTTPLTLTRNDSYFATALPGGGQRVVYGMTDLGLMNRGTPHILLYYPKAILGDAFASSSKVGESAVAELIPVGEAGDFRLLLLGHGKPQGDAEITIITPDGEEKVYKTDAEGRTESFTAEGRYAAWARYWEDKPGKRGDTAYEQVRHYATIVFDVGGEAQSGVGGASSAKQFARMPEATSSFGSATVDDWLYVYGGHVSPTHVYSTEAVSGQFARMRLKGEPVWESLPGGLGVQGMNLAAHGRYVYRVGGMAPRNKPGDAADNYSVADAARFDTKKKKWEPLPDLPEPRSSHDVVVVGDTLFIIGGWNMKGDEGQEWFDTFLSLDLSQKKASWQEHPVPFRRRALMAAGFEGKMYVVGGFTDNHQIQRTVSIYDPATEQWSEGPEIPEGGRAVGFAPAAGVHEGRLYVSVADGVLWRLSESGDAWEKAGTSAPRVAHRIASHDAGVLVLGGAADGDNLDSVEAVPVSE